MIGVVKMRMGSRKEKTLLGSYTMFKDDQKQYHAGNAMFLKLSLTVLQLFLF